MTLTKLETLVLECNRVRPLPARQRKPPRNIRRHLRAVWSFSVSDSVSGSMNRRALAGVMSSLVKKGLVICYKGTNRMCHGTNQDPDTMMMTASGFTVWNKLCPADVEVAAEPVDMPDFFETAALEVL